MPIPIIDASQALKASPEKTEDALLKVCLKTRRMYGSRNAVSLVVYHRDFSFVSFSLDWELFVQKPWNQKIPAGAGLSASAGHRHHNHTAGVHTNGDRNTAVADFIYTVTGQNKLFI